MTRYSCSGGDGFLVWIMQITRKRSVIDCGTVDLKAQDAIMNRKSLVVEKIVLKSRSSASESAVILG